MSSITGLIDHDTIFIVGDLVKTREDSEYEYEIAEIKRFPHGPMIGIYDEPPSKHVDFWSPKNLTLSNKKPMENCDQNQGRRASVSPEQIQALNDIRDALHGDMRSMGWHDDTMDQLEFAKTTTANIHGEVSEFWEAWRRNKQWSPCDKADVMEKLGLHALNCVEEELADIIIRAMDTAGRFGIDIGRAIMVKQEANMTRGYRYGGKLA